MTDDNEPHDTDAEALRADAERWRKHVCPAHIDEGLPLVREVKELRAEVERLREVDARRTHLLATHDVPMLKAAQRERDAAVARERDLRAAVAAALVAEESRSDMTTTTRLAVLRDDLLRALRASRAALAAHPEPDAAPLYAEDGAPHALVPGTSTDDAPDSPGDPRWCDRCGRGAADPAHAPTPPALTVTREQVAAAWRTTGWAENDEGTPWMHRVEFARALGVTVVDAPKPAAFECRGQQDG